MDRPVMGGLHNQMTRNQRDLTLRVSGFDTGMDCGFHLATHLSLLVQVLQHAERSPDHQVDWTQYDGWGGANVVLGTKFDEWWEERWKELFATTVKGDEPKFPLSTNRPKPDGIRYALLIYENQ